MSTRLPRRRIIVSLAALLLGALALGWMFVQDQHQGAQLDALYAALGDEQSNAEAQGLDPVAPDPEDLLEDPEYTPQPGPSGPPGPAGPGLSDPEIQAAFADYFAAHPYEFEPSAAELTAAFASVLSDHPDLLNDQLYAAMASYLAANPAPPGPAGADGKDGADGVDGQDGAQGDPGRPPTEEEIQDAVEAYEAEHPPPPACPEGSDFEARTLLTLDGPPVEAVICVAA